MTYPNVLVMSYLKETRQLTPEWQMKLETAINAGWQRLLTFRVKKDGGFDWYGQEPGKILLTAYGVMELSDMNRVYPIDQRVIDEAVGFLFMRMKGDHWEIDLPAHSWSQVGGDVAVTAYVLWSLHEAHVNDNRLSTAERWLSAQSVEDPYIAALVALATGKGADLLESKFDSEGRLATKLAGAYYARGDAASIEATALGTLALIRGKRAADKPLASLIRAKDPEGGWHSTQATILAIKALLEASHAAPPAKPVHVRARVNGEELSFDVDAKNFEVVQDRDVSKFLRPGSNAVEVVADGELHPNVQLAGRCYLPWSVVVPAPESPLSIEVTYDKTRLTQADVLKAAVKMKYTGPGTFMVIADLGIPPGFDVDLESFENMLRKEIDKYTVAGRQITLYFGKVSKGQIITFEYLLRPRFPVRAQSPRSSAYEYYTPSNQGAGKPTRLEVLEKR